MITPDLNWFDRFALDTETTGLQYKKDKVFGISISTPDKKDYYWDIRNEPRIVEWLYQSLLNYRGKVIYANASFDIRMLSHIGVERLLYNDIQDVIVRASCINEHEVSYSLDNLAKKYLGIGKTTEIYEELAKLFGGRATRNVQMKNIHRAPIGVVSPYAKRDTRAALDLYDWQEEEIKRQGIEEIVEFETGLIPIFIGMEMHGIRIDPDYAEHAYAKMTPIIDEKQQQINALFGTTVNVNSSPQVKSLFSPAQRPDGIWVANDGTELESTTKGNASLGADALREMAHPGAKMILELRSLIKTRDTFLGGHVLGSSVNGRVYPTINQGKSETGGTGTGRLAIQNPAMQQIPSRNKKVAALIKPCFLPDEGEIWVDGDMASFEVRVFAHLSKNPKVLAAYEANPKLDFHQFVADLTGLVRNAEYSGQPNAKQLNLSMIFNSGNGAIADKMGMPWDWSEFTDRTGKLIRYKKAGKEATDVINNYHHRLGGIKELAEGAARVAKQRGYIYTQHGRHLRFPRGWKTYKASGILIQSTAADINKENIKLITQYLREHKGSLLLNTHDSYSMSMPEDQWERQFKDIQELLQRPVLRVPLLFELSGVGKNWYEAVKKE